MDGFWLNRTIDEWQGKIPGLIRELDTQITMETQQRTRISSYGRVGNKRVAATEPSALTAAINLATTQRSFIDSTVRSRLISLKSTGYQTDNAVAQMVKDSQNAFFNKYNWLRPPTRTSSFWDGWNKFWGDVFSSVWKGIKSFFTNSAIFQMIVSGLETVAGAVFVVIGGVSLFATGGLSTPLSALAIAGGLAMIAHGSGGFQEGIGMLRGDETPSNWLKDMVGETAYNIIGIGGAVAATVATGGLSGLFMLGTGMGVGMGSSWVAENVFHLDPTVSQWIGLGAGMFAAWGASRIAKIWTKPNVIENNSLPKTTAKSVTQKLDNYLLETTHPEGGNKAIWFKEALGFDKSNARALAKQIKFDLSKATPTELTQFGQKYAQVIKISGANGRIIDVKFVWIRNPDGIVRLVTSIPTKK